MSQQERIQDSRGREHTTLPYFSRKLHELKKIYWYPLRSATAQCDWMLDNAVSECIGVLSFTK